MTRLDILHQQLKRNKGHSVEKHNGLSFEETGFKQGCYRCEILEKIVKEREKVEQEQGKKEVLQ